MHDQPLVSIVLSFRNEEAVILELIRRLQAVLRSLPVRYELIFVNDASSDKSLDLLIQQKSSEEPAIKIINMSRRFGVSQCALAGLEYAKGDAVILMDADLQDPPEVIPELVEKWKQGADVVYTVRASRVGESAFRIWATKQAYRVIRLISDIDLPENAGDFKLISRMALHQLLKLKNEQDPYLRGMVSWVGLKQVPVIYHRQARGAGQSHYPLFRSKGPTQMLINGITSFSLFPLYVFIALGLLMGLLSGLALITLVILMCLRVPLPSGSLLAFALLLFSAIQLTGIGVLGIYLGRVYNEVRRRPNYLVESLIGFHDEPEGKAKK